MNTINDLIIKALGFVLALFIGIPLFVCMAILITVVTLPVYLVVCVVERTSERWHGKRLDIRYSDEFYDWLLTAYGLSIIPAYYFFVMSDILDE